MDRKGPEHHYDELESPENGRSIVWQQGEVAPDHVNVEGKGYDLRSPSGGRPYRDQPSPTESDMTERNTVINGEGEDQGGSPLRTDKGILYSASKNEEDEDLEQIDEATEPKGLGKIDPVPDHDWKSGDISDRSMGRDEMLGSVRKTTSDELWDQVVADFENATNDQPDPSEKVASASWLENDEDFPTEHLGWELVDVVEPSKEHIEAANKYTMPIPNGITDELHEALIKTNAWVENPEENGKLRPYKQYWSAIRPKIREGNIQIGVETPHMADIINHVARTGDLSPLNKESSVQKESFFTKVLPKLVPFMRGALDKGVNLAKGYSALKGGEAMFEGAKDLLTDEESNDQEEQITKSPDMFEKTKNLLTGEVVDSQGNVQEKQVSDPINQAIESVMPNIAVPEGMPLDYSNTVASVKQSIYGENFDHPSTVNRRVQDPENGELFPSTRTQTVDGPLGDQEWQRDYMDVNEMGQSKDIRGTDDAQERRKRIMSSNVAEEIIEEFTKLFPKIQDYAFSDRSGEDDPDIQNLHNKINKEFPNYLDSLSDDQISIFMIDDHNKEKVAAGPGFDKGPGFDGQAAPLTPDPTMIDKPKKPNVTDPSTHGMDPQAGPAGAAANAPGWTEQTSPNLTLNTQPLTQQEQQQANQLAQKQKQQQQLNQQQIMQQVQKKKAGDTQGPHTDEQQAAVAEMLIEQGREDEIPAMLESPADYDDELAEIQNKQPMLDEDPKDAAPEGAAPAAAPPGVPPGGMPPMPNEGMPAGVPPMGAPTPGDLNPAGAGAMQPPAMQLGASVTSSMLNAAFKYGADNVAGTCPKCDSHTTKMMQQDGKSKCHTCGNEWQDKAYQKSDGDSSHSTTTASFYAAMDSFVDEDVQEEIIDDSSNTWTDENGEPLQEGQEYQIYAHNYEIPDIGRVVELKPDAVVYEIESDGGLRTTIEIDRQEADLNGYRFVATSEGSEENPSGMEENMDSKPYRAPGDSTDLSTPHREIGASVKNATVTYYMCPVAGCPNNQGGGDYEPGTCSIHNKELVPAGQEKSAHKTAGKHYTPMEQRELIDEYGEARNADKLNLEGTHYADSDDDHFLFGC